MLTGLRNLDAASQVKYRITLEHERITTGWEVFLAIGLLGQQQARVEPVNGEMVWHLESGESEILGLLLSDPDKSMTAEEIAECYQFSDSKWPVLMLVSMRSTEPLKVVRAGK